MLYHVIIVISSCLRVAADRNDSKDGSHWSRQKVQGGQWQAAWANICYHDSYWFMIRERVPCKIMQHTHLPLRDASFLATDTEIAFCWAFASHLLLGYTKQSSWSRRVSGTRRMPLLALKAARSSPQSTWLQVTMALWSHVIAIRSEDA